MKNNLLLLFKETPPKFKLQFLFIFLFVTINAILEVISIGALLPIIKVAQSANFIIEINKFLPNSLNFNPNTSKEELIKISCYFFLLIFLLKTLFSIFVIKYQTSVLANIKFELSNFFFKVYSKKNYEFYKLNSSNKILVDIDKNITEFCNRFLLSGIFIISEFIIILGFIIFLYLLGEGNFIFFIVILFLLLYLFNFLTKKKINNASKIWQSLNIKKIKILQEFVRGIKEIKAKRNGYFFVNSFKKLSKEFETTFGNFNFLQLFPKYIFELLALSSLVFYLIFTLNNQDLNKIISDFIIIFAVVLRLTPSISRINFHFSNIKFSITPFKKIVNLYENLSITRLKLKQIRDIKTIDFKNVYFKFDDQIIFENLNFKINKNDQICISGPSGSGKSTFIDLVCGLIKPSSGNILINNINFDKEKSYLPITYIPQDPIILDDSIRNNITFGDLKFDENRFNESINITELNVWIHNLQNKDKTIVGEFGGNISGGQKQRISLARGIYSNKEIIILDEPLSAVDDENKEKIFPKLLKFFSNKILIIVTHDQNNFKYFKKKFKLKDKSLVSDD